MNHLRLIPSIKIWC